MQPSSSSPKHIYFSGICGTAMASLAVLIKKKGFHVTGSDSNVYPPMSTFLEENQIQVLDGFNAENLNPIPNLVVIGNALSRGNEEVEKILEDGIRYISMAELLKEYFIRDRTSIVVTGTHGKTTTTSLLAWLFEAGKKQPGFMVGGIPDNFGTSCQDGGGQFFITEGDEYDTAFFDKRSKFLHYLPHQVILNNIEFDHADIFDSLDDILRSFRFFLRLVPRNGLIVANGDDENVMSLKEYMYSPVVTFGMGSSCEVQAKNIRFTENGSTFLLDWPGHCEQDFHTPLLGEHNIRNSMAGIIIALHNGISPLQIQEGLNQFISIKRRLELKGNPNGIEIYDDFAHHPTAIKETIHALHQKNPSQKIIAVFEPRSNTSVTKVHQKTLANAFVEADEVVLAYPHRMESIPKDNRLDIETILQELHDQRKAAYAFLTVPEIIVHLKKKAESGDAILVMSNGKFDNIHQKLLDQFT